jgi:hypothetical protein
VHLVDVYYTIQIYLFSLTNCGDVFSSNLVVRIVKNVKVKVKVKFTLEQATKSRRRSRGIALFFL